MAFRILAGFLLAVSAIHPEQQRCWRFYPMNTCDATAKTTNSGLVFNFSDPPAQTADVSVRYVDSGRDGQAAGTLDTRTGSLLRFPVRSLEDLSVRHISLTCGQRAITVDNPRAGEAYGY